jgi:cysteine desulfurase family protein (TIGR01976 family)
MLHARSAPGESAYHAARLHFPSPELATRHSPSTVFLDNAGGSQMPGVVIDAITAYMRESFVQLGADYSVSRRATAIVAAAHRYLQTFMGAVSADGTTRGHVIIGASTSQLIYTLANAYAPHLKPGDEIVISQASHESNAGAWYRLAAPVEQCGRGVVIRPWNVDPRTFDHSLEELAPLMTERTRLVCFPHVSNILGRVADVPAITRFVHERGAQVIVDGVAFAPHRAVDVSAWNVDWYVYSTYKVFGPHMAALFGMHEALAPLTGPNHSFIPRTELPRKFELGGVSHEGAAGLVALDHFLRDLIGERRLEDPVDPHARYERSVVTRAFQTIEELETPLMRMLLEYLRSMPGIRIIGPETDGRERVGIVSFVKPSMSSASIARAGNAEGLGFRFGNFYAYRLCQSLGIDPADGVVRVSFCHYNTPEEVERLIGFLRTVL